MKSTGEVMGIDGDFNLAFAKAQLGAGDRLPTDGRLFVSVKDSDKPRILGAVRQLADWGWQVIATGGTADQLAGEGIPVERVNKVAAGRPYREWLVAGKCVSVRVTIGGRRLINKRTNTTSR